MHFNKGFAWLPVLLISFGVVIVVGAGYLFYNPISQAPVLNPLSIGTTTQPSGAPFIKVLSANSDYPATITVQYANLPSRTSGLAVCVKEGGCTEWVEEFHPSSSSGTYTMSAAKAFGPTSHKTLSRKEFIVVVLGSDFGDQIVASENFVVPDTVSVSGMSKYTDTDFGFSFWYPSGWALTKTAWPSGVSTVQIKEQVGTYPRTITITKETPTDGVMDASGACGSCAQIKYYFDKVNHVWMQIYDAAGNGGKTSQADVSHNTMGGLHILPTGARFGGSVVPLSAKNFLYVLGDDGGLTYNLDSAFTKTIVATDPAVATPVSAAEQTKIIQAEKDAYVPAAASASIDSETLPTIAGKYTLRGRATAGSILIVIEDMVGNTAYSSGAYSPIIVKDGRWSADIGTITHPGQYTIKIYSFSPYTLLLTQMFSVGIP